MAQLTRIAFTRVHRDQGAAATIVRRGRKEFSVPSAAIGLTITADDGTVIEGLWTIDEADEFFRQARRLIQDG